MAAVVNLFVLDLLCFISVCLYPKRADCRTRTYREETKKTLPRRPGRCNTVLQIGAPDWTEECSEGLDAFRFFFKQQRTTSTSTPPIRITHKPEKNVKPLIRCHNSEKRRPPIGIITLFTTAQKKRRRLRGNFSKKFWGWRGHKISLENFVRCTI